MTEAKEMKSESDSWPALDHPIRRFFTDELIKWINLERLFVELASKDNLSAMEKELLLILKFYRGVVVGVSEYSRHQGAPKRHLYYDWDGTPIQQWEAILKGEYFDRSVAKDIINGWLVSTVWLMINHNHVGPNSVLIFETMIFKYDESTPDNQEFLDFQERYSSYPEAQEGHQRACELVRNQTGKE